MKLVVSIIVPVYNIKQYLENCIDSIILQSFESKELILVDDGSTDGSDKICDKYAEKYSWIRAYHQDNGGLSAARNSGIRQAQGKYITFVDGDDYLNRNYLRDLYGAIAKTGANIAICNLKNVYKIDKSLINIDAAYKQKVYEGSDGVEALLYQKGFTSSACGKLFDRQLFKEITFPPGRLHEDVGTVYKLFVRADRVVYISGDLYYYIQHDKSIIHSDFSKKKLDYLILTNEMILFMREKYPSLVKAAYSRHLSACFQVIIMIPEHEYQEEYNEIICEIKKYRKYVMFDSKARLKNRVAALLSYININTAVSICRRIAKA